MSDHYIHTHFDDIRKYASVVEERGEDGECTLESVCTENAEVLELCKKYDVDYIFIDDEYRIDVEI